MADGHEQQQREQGAEQELGAGFRCGRPGPRRCACRVSGGARHDDGARRASVKVSGGEVRLDSELCGLLGRDGPGARNRAHSYAREQRQRHEKRPSPPAGRTGRASCADGTTVSAGHGGLSLCGRCAASSMPARACSWRGRTTEHGLATAQTDPDQVKA
jgi:hypothetical protein